jgi:hypothetical protein
MRRLYSVTQTPAKAHSRKIVYILITGIMLILGSSFYQTFQGQSANCQSNRDIKAFLMGSYKEWNNGTMLFQRKPHNAICHNVQLNVNVFYR